MYNAAMKRTTIMADERTIDRLKALAREEGRSLADVVREALEEKASNYRPRPESLGAGRSKPARTGASSGSRRIPARSWR
jgi:hypothetical protein